MNASTIRAISRFVPSLAVASVVGVLFATLVLAQSASAPAPVVMPLPTEVPDGSPQLAQEKVISSSSSGASGAAGASGSTNVRRPAGALVVDEERIQGRLSTAHVSVGGTRGYTVVDPDAGRSDRQSDNGGKRLSPSLWELFRF